MAISKVILNGETQMDVTPDTVTPEVMVQGYTALKNNGVRAVGTFVPNEGTVTEVATGTGLTGGPITSSGTIKANLVSETKLTNAATAATETAGRVYPVAVDKNGKLAVNVPWDNTTYTPASTAPKMDGTATVGTSVKYAREDHIHPSDTSRVPTSRKVNNKALSADISLTASDVGAIATSAKGAASGVAELDSNGKVPSSQLPSFVDDVLEYNGTSSFPTTGETGKIYVDTSTNKTYRWGGSSYTEISASLALGETSSTAYRGDRGKTAYTHATDSSRLTTATSSGLYKVASTAEGHIASLTAVTKADITGLGIPSTNTWTAMTGATSSANGTVGYVNAVPPKDGYNTKYLRADGTWTVPPDNNTTYGLSISDHTVSLVAGGTTTSVTVPDNNTTYESKAAASGGTAVSLVTTGEKYTWNNKLSSHQTIKQDGVTGATVNRFCTCGTAAGTAAKTASITTGTFALEAGSMVAVSFTNANTAGNPTLNIGSTGAKNVFVNGARITTGTNKAMLKGTVLFIYDGTQYHLIGNYTDTNTTYTANTASIGSASGWSAGSAPSLSYTSRSIPNVTSVGSKPSLSYTSRSIPNVTGVGSVPSLSYTARSVGSASGWSAGTAASASVANGVLTITNGTAPSLTVTSVACDDITAWDSGSTPTLGTAISADDITAWDAGSTPTLGTAISADDITAWSAGSVPSLTVTSTTVATGITAS